MAELILAVVALALFAGVMTFFDVRRRRQRMKDWEARNPGHPWNDKLR